MLFRLTIWLLALCLFGAPLAAAAEATSCTSRPQSGRAESSALAFSMLDADGTPAGKNTVWQPLGGTVGFSLKGSDLVNRPPVVCFAYHGGAFVPSPRVWLQDTATATNTLIYNATVPSKLKGRPHLFVTGARTGIIALSGEVRVIVPGEKGGVSSEITVPIGITSAVLAAFVALVAVALAFAFALGVARWLNVPGTWLLKVISTRAGVASLSQLQVILWVFVIGAGAIYVMALTGALIDISDGALVLLGISGAATVASKAQNAQTSGQSAGAPSTTQRPGQATGLRAIERDESEVSLAWDEPASGGQVRGYRVQYRLASTALSPMPGPWLTAGETLMTTWYRVINLDPGTRYEFQVIAVNEYGIAEKPSDSTAETTLVRPPVANGPAQVAGLRLSRPPQLGRIDLAWVPTAAATSYRLQTRPHDIDDVWTDYDAAIGDAEVAISTGIESARRYDIRVAARSVAGVGPWSAVLVVRAQRQPVWADLVIKPESNSEIDVTRLQMLFFTVITALFVTIKIAYSYAIPEIPQGFLTLMGISNGIYLTAKFVPDK